MAVRGRRKSFRIGDHERVAKAVLSGQTSIKLIRPTRYDFGPLCKSRQDASDLALALLRSTRHRSHSTQQGMFTSLRDFANFLGNAEAKKAGDVLTAYYEHMLHQRSRRIRKRNDNSISGAYRNVRIALQTIAEQPLLKKYRTSFPRCPMPTRFGQIRQKQSLSTSIIESVAAAARSEILKFRESSPSAVSMRDLIPYAILIAIKTWANPSSIWNLTVDCLSEHPLDERRVVVQWRKNRSSRRQYRSFLASSDFDPPRLINELLELTRPFRENARKEDRSFLFLYQPAGSYSGPKYPRSIPYDHVNVKLREFREANDLPYFNFVKIRLSAIQSTLNVTRNVRIVQRLANHAGRHTTVRYLRSPDIVELCDEVIADAQRDFRLALVSDLSNPTAIRRALNVDQNAARAIAAGHNATLTGFTCRNPYEGIARGSKRGELCPNFMACFTCPNAVLGNDVKTIAHLLRFKYALQRDEAAMRAERFDYLYRPILRMLTEHILPLYSDQQLLEGRRLALTLPTLLSFADE